MNLFSTFQHYQEQAIKLSALNFLVISSETILAMMMSMYMRMRMQ